MTEQLLSVERGCDPMSLRLGGQPVGFIFDEPADAVAAELDRLYAAAEANQAPGPDPDGEAPDDLLYRAWGLIANACGGDWDEADRLSPGWKAAAIGWRDAWHATLPGSADAGPAPTPDPDAPPVYVPPEGHVAPVEGRNVPDGWEGRYLNGGDRAFDAEHCRSVPDALFEVRRVPAPEPATEWVPLTKLVGRTIKGQTEPVMGHGHDHDPSRWWPEANGVYLSFPDGTLNLDTAQVLVLAEGER